MNEQRAIQAPRTIDQVCRSTRFADILHHALRQLNNTVVGEVASVDLATISGYQTSNHHRSITEAELHPRLATLRDGAALCITPTLTR